MSVPWDFREGLLRSENPSRGRYAGRATFGPGLLLLGPGSEIGLCLVDGGCLNPELFGRAGDHADCTPCLGVLV